MDTRGEVAAATRPILAAMRDRLGDAFFEGESSREVRGLVTPGGIPVVVAGELSYLLDPVTGELMAVRRGEDGAPETGGVDSDGTVRWREAIVHRDSFN